MGVVKLCRAHSGPSAGHYVAVKRLHSHLEKQKDVTDAFLDEVWLTAALQHPNVVEPIDWGHDADGSFLVMQFVPGDSLRALLRACELQQFPVPIDVVVEIIARAAAGLHAAHEVGNEGGESLHVVHRDVSPANILLGFDGSVKLIDFGVAKRGDRIVTTQTGTIKGKVGYMSPEQVRGKKLDRRSDIFSLGVVAWEALTLCRLYSAPSEFDAVRMICEEEPVAPSEIRGDVPTALDAVVLRCLAKDRALRFATCADLEAALAPFRPDPARGDAIIADLAVRMMIDRLHWIESLIGAPTTAQTSGPVSAEIGTRGDTVISEQSLPDATEIAIESPAVVARGDLRGPTWSSGAPPTAADADTAFVDVGSGEGPSKSSRARVDETLASSARIEPRRRAILRAWRRDRRLIPLAVLVGVGVLALLLGLWLGRV